MESGEKADILQRMATQKKFSPHRFRDWCRVMWSLLALISLACTLPALLAKQAVRATPTPFLVAKPSATPSMSPTLTFTLLPTATPSATPTQTSTPTLTPTPLVLVNAQTPLPLVFPPVMWENASQVSALAEWQERTVTDMAWLPEGTVLAVSDQDTIHLYDVVTRRVVRSLYSQGEGIVDIAISPSGKWLVVGCRRGSETESYFSDLQLWSAPDWKPLGVLFQVDRALTGMSFSANSRMFSVAFSSPVESQNSIQIWNVPTWTITDTLKMGAVLNVAFTPAGDLLAATPDHYALKIWDTRQAKWLFNLRTAFTDAVNEIAFAPDGLTLASGHYDGTIRLWDMRSGTLLFTIQAEEVIESLAFSPDGRILASGGSFKNQYVRLWDARTGDLLRTLEGHRSGVTHLLFSPTSQYLISASYDGMLRLWGVRP